MKKLLETFILLTLLVLLVSCSQKPTDPQTLKLALLPVLDTLPDYVAETQGYFTEQGLEVEFVQVMSAPERDQLMQAGQVDGMLNEIVSTMLYNREGTRVVVVRYARIATEDYPIFRILAAPGSGIYTAEDLRGVPIGISEGIVIEYTTDRLLEHAGLSLEDIQKISIPKIPDRMALLGSGEVLAANLPDPVASLAILNGSTVVIDDTSYPEISYSVWSFSIETINQKPEAVRGFLAALEQAIEDINADKGKWDNLLMERNLVLEPILGSYVLLDFPTSSVPGEAQFEDAHSWLRQKGLIEHDLSYNKSIDSSFLPR